MIINHLRFINAQQISQSEATIFIHDKELVTKMNSDTACALNKEKKEKKNKWLVSDYSQQTLILHHAGKSKLIKKKIDIMPWEGIILNGDYNI